MPPKFPIYIVTLLFVVGMLIPPWTENECLIWSSVIIPFLGALFKKYRVLAYLFFFLWVTFTSNNFIVRPNQITVILQQQKIKKIS